MAVEVEIKANAPTQPLQKFGASLVDLNKLLKQAQADFAAAAPGTDAYYAAIKAVGELSGQIADVLKPVRDYAKEQVKAAEATRNLNAIMTSGVNPWTTASEGYRKAQAALQAEAAAAKQAAQAHQELARAKQESSREQRSEAVLGAWRQTAADLREAEVATRRLYEASKKANDEKKKTPAILDPATKSTGNAGQAVLAFSQGLEDAQYGIRGVLNNIPGLVMAMGGGMGLAGVISVAAVALSVLSESFGNAKKEADKLQWNKLTPDEQAIERINKFNEGLKAQSELLDSLNERWLKQVKLRAEAMELEKQLAAHQDAMEKRLGGDGDPQSTLRSYDRRKAIREQGLANDENDSIGKKVAADRTAEFAAEAEVRAREQEQKIQDLDKRGNVEKEYAAAQEKLKAAEEHRMKVQGYSRGMMPAGDKRALDESVAKEQAEVNRLAKSLKDLPTADGYQPTGDVEKDEEAKKTAFQREKDLARQRREEADALRKDARTAQDGANDANRKLEQNRKKAGWEQEQDDFDTSQQVAKEAGLPAPLPTPPGEVNPLLDPNARSVITKGQAPTPPESQGERDKRINEEDAAAQQEQVKAAADQLRQHIAASQGEMKSLLQGMLEALTDGKGNTAGELAQVQSMFAQAQAERGMSINLLKQTAMAMAELERNLVGAIDMVATKMFSMAATIGQQGSAIEQLQINRNA